MKKAPTVKIEPSKGGFNSDDKRMHVPATLKATCPNCGYEFERNFSRGNDYFSYPVINAPLVKKLYCFSCGHEWAIIVQINLTLTLYEPEAIS